MAAGPQYPAMYSAASQLGQFLAQQPQHGFEQMPDTGQYGPGAMQQMPQQFGPTNAFGGPDPQQQFAFGGPQPEMINGINGGPFAMGPQGGMGQGPMGDYGPAIGGGMGMPQDMGQQQPPQGGPQGGQDDQQGGWWQHLGQYLGSPEGQDGLMRGAIGILAGTNPEAAMQLAVQYRQHIDQRNWQAQQNQLQREATAQNIKSRGEYAQQQKDDAQQRTLAYKIDQSRKDIAALGKQPPDVPDDPAAWPAYFEDLRTIQAAGKREEMDKKQADKDESAAFSRAYKTGQIPDGYEDNGVVRAAAAAAAERIGRSNERLALQKDREAQLKKLRGNKDHYAKVGLQADRLKRDIANLDKDLDNYEKKVDELRADPAYKMSAEDGAWRVQTDKLIDDYQERISKANEKRDGLLEKWDGLVEISGEPRVPEPAPKPGEAPGGEAPPPNNESPGTPGTGQASDRAISNFRRAWMSGNDEIKQMLIREWVSQYETPPPVSSPGE